MHECLGSFYRFLDDSAEAPAVDASESSITGTSCYHSASFFRSIPLTIQVGDQIPEVGLTVMIDGKPRPQSKDVLFGGKKVVLFAVPGAFTPTCTMAHLPSFVVNADEIFAKGVDSIICLSVNDVFVMDAWGKDKNADALVMAADGNGEFTKAVGLELDASGFGMGIRSERYAMVVDDGVVSALQVEAPGKFEVSSAEAVLAVL